MSASLRFLANGLDLAAESIKKEFLFHLYPFFVGAQLTSPGTGILALSQAHFSRWLSAPGVQPAEEPGREKPASAVHSLQGMDRVSRGGRVSRGVCYPYLLIWKTSHPLAKRFFAYLWSGPCTQCHLKATGHTLEAGAGVPTFKKK